MLQVREEYRSEFLERSHELKTPLFTVQGYISTLDGLWRIKLFVKIPQASRKKG
jgi:two-component system phosphate regulon sensor histidine kinase PhoR